MRFLEELMANTSLPGEWHHALPVHVRARRGELEDTLTKDAVIDYLAKYMTKSGQGSLIQVMDHRSSRHWVRRA